MGLFDAISGLITGSVGNNMDNHEDDVLNVKRNLNKVGYFDDLDQEPEPHGFITKNMEKGIRSYQKDKGLKVDGILHPRGETERGLFHTITGQILEPLFGETDGFDEGTVGFGGNVSGTFGTNPFGKWNERSRTPPYAMALAGKEETGQPASTPPAPPSKPEAAEAPPVNLIAAQVEQKTNNPDAPPPIPPRKPETISPTQKGNELLDFIGKHESSNNYNITYGSKEEPLTKMTVKEVYALQKKMLAEGRGSSAVGRYQFLKGTLKEAVDKLGIDESEFFDKKLQDQLARSRMEYRGYEEYKAGKISTEELIKGLANEWASLPPDASNKSRYEGVLNNKALTKFETLKDLLEKP
ncbi:MAG: peptidoglycan-binding protein [Alphaproteobacteria bacterium]|nr:peptidoglycan-binding protein [Alphaproteobacteria bacterium]